MLGSGRTGHQNRTRTRIESANDPAKAGEHSKEMSSIGKGPMGHMIGREVGYRCLPKIDCGTY